MAIAAPGTASGGGSTGGGQGATAATALNPSNPATLTDTDVRELHSGDPTPVPAGIPTVPASPVGPDTYRTTRPWYQTQAGSGYGTAFQTVPRRGWDSRTQGYISDVWRNPVGAVAQWAQSSPLRLLEVLTDIHPFLKAARSNVLDLAFSPGDVRLVAQKPDKTEDADGTALLEALFKGLPDETGGLTGILRTLARQSLWAGLCCLEAVPSPTDGEGLTDVITFDPLSIRFRDDRNANRYLEQDGPGGWRLLDRRRCFAIPTDGDRDNPYGCPGFSAALGEALNDSLRIGNLNDIFRTTAYPRLTVGYPFLEAVKYATENPIVCIGKGPGGGNLTPDQYAQNQLMGLRAKLETLKADDVFIYPTGGTVGVVNGASGLTGIKDMLEFFVRRFANGVDQLPTLLGWTDGGTQAYSSVNWGVQAKKFEGKRHVPDVAICKVGDLLFRLLGLDLTCRLEWEPIRATDVKEVAEAREVEIRNELTLLDAGFSDRVETSNTLVGHDPKGEDTRQKGPVAVPGAANAVSSAAPAPAATTPQKGK